MPDLVQALPSQVKQYPFTINFRLVLNSLAVQRPTVDLLKLLQVKIGRCQRI